MGVTEIEGKETDKRDDHSPIGGCPTRRGDLIETFVKAKAGEEEQEDNERNAEGVMDVIDISQEGRDLDPLRRNDAEDECGERNGGANEGHDRSTPLFIDASGEEPKNAS